MSTCVCHVDSVLHVSSLCVCMLASLCLMEERVSFRVTEWAVTQLPTARTDAGASISWSQILLPHRAVFPNLFHILVHKENGYVCIWHWGEEKGLLFLSKSTLPGHTKGWEHPYLSDTCYWSHSIFGEAPEWAGKTCEGRGWRFSVGPGCVENTWY